MAAPESELARQETDEWVAHENRHSLLNYCLTEDEFQEVCHGLQPAQVVARRDRALA